MNIAILTPYFPSLDLRSSGYVEPRTRFIYYYASEWAKQGHKVTIFHSVPKYPRLFTWFIRALKKFCMPIQAFERYVQDARIVTSCCYQVDGLTVMRIPISKFIPHRAYFHNTLKSHVKAVVSSLLSCKMQPDILLSDFLSPSIYIASHLRQKFGIPFFQILHQSDFRYLHSCSEEMNSALNLASGFLHRSFALECRFREFGLSSFYNEYIFSGIPSKTDLGTPSTPAAERLLYVGSLRQSKNVHVILQAMANCKLSDHLVLEIVGDGEFEHELKVLAASLGISKRVIFAGRQSRDVVFERMRQCDCLIMVSKETFGMVYVEAMSQGCIVVAAKGEGIDGIVVDGENGYLIDLDDLDALVDVLYKVCHLSDDEMIRVSRNAIDTAAKMKDDVLAKSLLDKLEANIGGTFERDH